MLEEGADKVIVAEEVQGTPGEREGVGAVDAAGAGVAVGVAAEDMQVFRGCVFALIRTLMTGRLL